MKSLLMSLAVVALLSVGTLTAVMAEDTTTTTPRAPKPAHEQVPPVTVTGAISKIEAPKNAAMPVNFTLTDATNVAYRVQSAPSAVLAKKGLTLADAATVTVTGSTSEFTGRNGVKMTRLTAQTITMGTNTYTLLEKGKPAWTLDDIAPFLTATGTVKSLVLPDQTPAPAATTTTTTTTATTTTPATPPAHKPMTPVTFTLATDKEALSFSFSSKQSDKLGLTLANDQKLTVTYWKFDGVNHLILRDITLDAKTYTFNDGTNVRL